ncbi:hypothetical protein H5U35_06475, partial [Candidatus Aerophobetes bacterium]|nr:hypothetical protein [Candidatus Aerophobetes bacterium]
MGKEKSILPFILKDPHFAKVDAVKNRFVFEIDQDTLERPGPRIVDGLESIASFIKSWYAERKR